MAQRFSVAETCAKLVFPSSLWLAEARNGKISWLLSLAERARSKLFLLNIQCWHLWNAAIDFTKAVNELTVKQESWESNSVGTSCVWCGLDEGGFKKWSPTLAERQSRATKCTVCVGTSWVGGEAVQWCPLPVQARQIATVGFCTVTFASGLCHGLRWFRLAAWSGWGLWASAQPAPVSQLVVRVQIETKPKCLNRANKYWVWLVEVDNLPLSCSVNVKIWTRAEILFLQMTSYQGGQALSAFKWAVKTSANMLLCSLPWRRRCGKAQFTQWSISLCRAASLFNVLRWPPCVWWFSSVCEFMCGILELTSWGGIFSFKDLGGEICFKDFRNVTAFSSCGVGELISSFNPYLMLFRLLYSCGKCWRDLHQICLALPCG